MADPYWDGYEAGWNGADTRSCGWEETKAVLHWTEGYRLGQRRRVMHDENKRRFPQDD